jgi:hypothetical protein
MKKEGRVFNPEDRLVIIQEGQREGSTATCRKYNCRLHCMPGGRAVFFKTQVKRIVKS